MIVDKFFRVCGQIRSSGKYAFCGPLMSFDAVKLAHDGDSHFVVRVKSLDARTLAQSTCCGWNTRTDAADHTEISAGTVGAYRPVVQENQCSNFRLRTRTRVLNGCCKCHSNNAAHRLGSV